MNNKNEKSNNKLGFKLFEAEADLQRHPSVKGLYDEEGNLMIPSKSNDEFFILDIKKRIEKNSNTNNSNNKNEDNGKEKENDTKNRMSVKINRVKEKAVDYKDTFYVEMNDEEKKKYFK